MSASLQNPLAADQRIFSMLAAIGWHWRRRQVWMFTAIAAIFTVTWLGAMLVADAWTILSTEQLRGGWLVLMLGLVVVIAGVLHRVTWGKPDAVTMARLYESRASSQGNRLVNALQLLLSGRAAHDPAAWAVVAENAPQLKVEDARVAVDLSPVRRAWLTAGALGVALFIYAICTPASTLNALSRVMQPLSPPPHLLSTQIDLLPGDVTLVEGQSLTIEAKLARHLPSEAFLEYRIGNLDWTRQAMARVDERTYNFTKLTGIAQPITYRVLAGRSRSNEHRVKVLLRPRVQKLQATLAPPAYVKQPDKALPPNTGDISALAGSRIMLDLVASSPLKQGVLESSDGRVTQLSIESASPTQARVQFTLEQSGSYAIRLTDHEGLESVNPPRYSLTAQEDQPALVLIAQPGRDLILPAATPLPVIIEGQDDYGLASVALEVRAGQGDWKAVQQWNLNHPVTRRKSLGTELQLASMGMKVGDLVLYRAVARDIREPQANVSISRVWSITISESTGDRSLLAAQARKLLEAIQKILAMQRENRAAVDMDLPIEPIRQRQPQIRDLTLAAIDMERRAARPMQSMVDELASLADGLMLQANELTASYGGKYEQRIKLKPPVLSVMDQIIARLEALTQKLEKSLASADQAQKALEQLSPQDREQALQKIRATLEKLKKFLPEQDKVIEDTKELARKGENLTDPDLQKLEQTRGTEDAWSKVFAAGVDDINKLTEQGFADRTMVSDYKEMVEQIEAAVLNLKPKLIELAVPRELSGRELAESLKEDMEMWLPSSPDNLKWMMEEPLDKPPIPMAELPEQLRDMIGDLLEQQEELNEAADDLTSSWADSMSAAGWGVGDGPISNFSAKGVTGNQVPNNSEMSGRAGDGRSGRSQGQMVEDTAKGLAGRDTPTRITNDPYEQGVVKELQKLAASGATGGGKARGSGQEGLQGQAPPPMFKDMQYMKDWQQRLRQKAERIAGEANAAKVRIAELDKSIKLMKDAEQAAKDGRYGEMFKKQQMVLSQLKLAGDAATRDVALRIDQARRLPEGQRKQMLDSMDEPVPQEFEGAVRRYFLQLSEDK